MKVTQHRPLDVRSLEHATQAAAARQDRARLAWPTVPAIDRGVWHAGVMLALPMLLARAGGSMGGRRHERLRARALRPGARSSAPAAARTTQRGDGHKSSVVAHCCMPDRRVSPGQPRLLPSQHLAAVAAAAAAAPAQAAWRPQGLPSARPCRAGQRHRSADHRQRKGTLPTQPCLPAAQARFRQTPQPRCAQPQTAVRRMSAGAERSAARGEALRVHNGLTGRASIARIGRVR